MKYGLQIGSKFHTDGTPEIYPGNTVIADVDAQNPAWKVIHGLRVILQKGEVGSCFIFLPEDSYHMTVLRGLNDQVRTAQYWPPGLPADVSMEAADDFFESRINSIPSPGNIHMRFSHVSIDGHDVRICLTPWDGGQEQRLRAYRDAAADKLGLRLPGHDAYVYHVTLAYVLHIPEGLLFKELEERKGQMDLYLKEQEGFWLSPPRIAFYRDMLCFYSSRIPRS